jgi:predicted GNAT family acetyltransferase
MDYTIINNTAKNRFELTTEGITSVVEYKLFDGGISLNHTEVPHQLEGKGIASALAKFALEYAKTNNLKVLPLCPFIYTYISRHPEYKALSLKHQQP